MTETASDPAAMHSNRSEKNDSSGPIPQESTTSADAVAASNALVGEPVMVDEEDDTGEAPRSTPSTNTSAANSPPQRQANSSSDSPAGESVGMIASGLAWVLAGQQSRRRRMYLQQEAQEQWNKVQQQQKQQSNSNMEDSSSSLPLAQATAPETTPKTTPEAITRLSASGDGYTVQFDLDTIETVAAPDEGANEEHDVSWIPTVRVVDPCSTLSSDNSISRSGGDENIDEDENDVSCTSRTPSSRTIGQKAPLDNETNPNNELATISELSPPCLLSAHQRQQIAVSVLPRQIAATSWIRLYSLQRDGDSFDTCLRLLAGHDKTLMVIQTSRNQLLGGYADMAWCPEHHHHHGGGQLAHHHAVTMPHPSSGSHHVHYHGGPQSCLFRLDKATDKVRVYKWTGVNRYIQLCDVPHRRLAFGGSGHTSESKETKVSNADEDENWASSWCFGLSVEDDFQLGSTGPCDTFHNEPLCDEETFDIVNMEIFGFLVGQF